MRGKFTILGSGTSQGIPVIGCQCIVCKSIDHKDNRLRCAALINYNGNNFVIDSGPDFRTQMLKFDVQDLRGVLLTHEHKDHIAGLDDIRAFNFKQKEPMNIFCTSQVRKALEREFYYAFLDEKHPGIPDFNVVEIGLKNFYVSDELEITPIEVRHYKMPVMGFRIGDLTYITDAKYIEQKEINKIIGSRTLIINALRIQEHLSHFNLDEALDLIQIIKPENAYLTHISHLFGTHSNINKILPTHVFAAYDGLELDFYT